MKRLVSERLNHFPESLEMTVVIEDPNMKEPKPVGFIRGIPFGAYEVTYDYDDCCSMYPPKPIKDVFIVFHGDGEPYLIPRWKYYQFSIADLNKWLSKLR